MGFYSASQLVQDAQRHQIEIMPVCINHSDVNHKLENKLSPSICLGLRQVKGLSKKGMYRVVEARPKEGYCTTLQVKSIGLSRQDIEVLASANAFRNLSSNRYATRWDLMNTEGELPLLSSTQQDLNKWPSPKDRHDAFQFQPNAFETLLEDYASIGLTLESHPITLLDRAGKIGAFSRANQLLEIPHKSFVNVVGVVTGRQAPGSAAGVTFMTLEDDTGNINVVVWAGTARAQKQPFLTAKVLKIKGILEREGEVIHVIAGKLSDMTDHLGSLSSSSRDFH